MSSPASWISAPAPITDRPYRATSGVVASDVARNATAIGDSATPARIGLKPSVPWITSV